MNYLTIYRSSAGSGKTYTLVKEYLLLILKNDASYSYKNILAITFTNKATSEMKSRILLALKELSKSLVETDKYYDLKRELCVVLEVEDTTLSNRAERVLWHILHHYSDFAISTIDKFTFKIVKSFSYDLDLPLHFEIELDDEAIIELCLDALFKEAGTNPWLTKLLLEFLKSNTLVEKNWKIDQIMKEFAHKILDEDAHLFLNTEAEIGEQEFQAILKNIRDKKKEFADALLLPIQSLEQLLQQHQIQNDWFAYSTKSGLPAYLRKVKAKINSNIFTKFADFLLNTHARVGIDKGKWYSNTLDGSSKAKMDVVHDDINRYLQSIQEILEKHKHDAIICSLLDATLYPVVLLNEIKKFSHQIMNELHQVHISEFNKRISEIIMKEPVPYIYERIGEKYKHFLMDEFQDTSKLQWQNLLPLVEDSIANGKKNLVVGDGKQAIYRWRGGEVEQFMNLPHDPFKKQYVASAEEWDMHFQTLTLNQNYRSKREIIEFNNYFFEHLALSLSERWAPIYFEQKQQFKEDNTGGYIEIKYLVNEKKEAETEELEDASFIDYDYIVQIIRDCVADGYAWKDIAILARNNKTLQNISQVLIEENIPIVSSESLLLSSSPEILTMVSFLRWLNRKESSENQAKLLSNLYKNKLVQADQLLNLVNKPDEIELFIERQFGISESEWAHFSLYELVENLIFYLKFNAKESAFIQSFLDIIYAFQSKKQNSVYDFLDYWERKKHKLVVAVSEDSDAVQLLTIHKSKGLEFPVVIIPNINGKLNNLNHKKYFWEKPTEPYLQGLPFMLLPNTKDLKETRYGDLYRAEEEKNVLDHFNLLYVAFTRAADRLYAFSVVAKMELNAKDENTQLHHFYSPFLWNNAAWNAEQATWIQGQKIKITRKEEKISENTVPVYSYNAPWREKIQLNLENKKFKKSAGLDYGNKMHALLANIYSKEDIAGVVHRYFLKGILNTEEVKNIGLVLEEILSIPSIAPYYAPDIRVENEREILLETAEIVRPDRVVNTPEAWVIIDYKTGQKKEEHQKQLDFYAQILQEVEFKPAKKILIYIETKEVVEWG